MMLFQQAKDYAESAQDRKNSKFLNKNFWIGVSSNSRLQHPESTLETWVLTHTLPLCWATTWWWEKVFCRRPDQLDQQKKEWFNGEISDTNHFSLCVIITIPFTARRQRGRVPFTVKCDSEKYYWLKNAMRYAISKSILVSMLSIIYYHSDCKTRFYYWLQNANLRGSDRGSDGNGLTREPTVSRWAWKCPLDVHRCVKVPSRPSRCHTVASLCELSVIWFTEGRCCFPPGAECNCGTSPESYA
jgi:hypothetical protein